MQEDVFFVLTLCHNQEISSVKFLVTEVYDIGMTAVMLLNSISDTFGIVANTELRENYVLRHRM